MSECDRKTSTKGRPRITRGCRAMMGEGGGCKMAPVKVYKIITGKCFGCLYKPSSLHTGGLWQ